MEAPGRRLHRAGLLPPGRLLPQQGGGAQPRRPGRTVGPGGAVRAGGDDKVWEGGGRGGGGGGVGYAQIPEQELSYACGGGAWEGKESA